LFGETERLRGQGLERSAHGIVVGGFSDQIALKKTKKKLL
jgi:hypothetical protein